MELTAAGPYISEPRTLALCSLAASGSLARGEARSRRVKWMRRGSGRRSAVRGAARGGRESFRAAAPRRPLQLIASAARRSHATGAPSRTRARRWHTHVMRIDCVRRLRSFPSAFSRSQEHHFALHHALDAVIVSFSSRPLPAQPSADDLRPLALG